MLLSKEDVPFLTYLVYYVNYLITKLRNINVGCRYSTEYIGVYADDISLLSDSFNWILKIKC